MIVLAFGLSIYAYNFLDARKDAIAKEKGKVNPTLLQGVRDFYNNGFPYFMILPGLMMLLFIVVLPLVFMVGLAFTDYNQYNAPPS
ncbi:maltose/maltodextrin ABC transporter [Gracilibacillus boraciitolerans JCM 21714]|uniref:Maltose/maltodextrin ABC transporter n=1 Tax=Gracilibacillus boraciitolerans JCM 21714 TaxID=1298598 RepID=W4VJ18_9BACI|nr:maltose/maltodextrin ABC transporter [Gracilibacillus boraciitolerans JCM 21714]